MKEWREKSIRFINRVFSAYNYLSIYLLLLVIFNIALLNLPLTYYLGYEFSILNSAIIILLIGIFTLLYLRKNKILKENVKGIITTLGLIAFIFLLIPFLISFLSLFKAVTCPIEDGIIFYIFLTIPAPAVGIAIALLSFSFSKKFSILIFFLSILVIASIPVFEIYFNPQIYFYNPIIGFFPGTIYDEGITVDFKLMAYRLLNLSFFISIIFLIIRALLSSSRYSMRIAWIYSIIIPIAFIIVSPDLGYSTSYARIKNELDKTIISENFEIHYSSKLNDTLVNVIALHHEFYYSELEKFFKAKPKQKISSIIFDNRGQKKRLFGTANADVAKPWIPEIYITADSYDRTLKHELAHCFAGVFGSRIFKVADNFNPSLIEGIAEAADPNYDEFDLDYLAALAFVNGYKVDITKLFKSFNFFGQPSSLGYIIAGSFSKFLIEKYGIELFKNLYTDINFEKYYKKELVSLGAEYEAQLMQKFIFDSTAIHRAKYYYGRKSIFYKICPRYVAKKVSEGWTLLNQNRILEAKEIFNELFKLSDNYSSLIGLANCYDELKQSRKAIDLLRENINKYENTAYFYEIEFFLADLLAKNNQVHEADSIYKSLISQNPNRTLYSLSILRSDLIDMDTIIVKYLQAESEGKYSIIKLLNSKNYNYNSFVYLSSLAKADYISYENFLKNFTMVLEVNDYISSFGIYKLSSYMCEKMDFERARKMAALSLRSRGDESLNPILKSNFEKINWMYKNASEALAKMNFLN